MMPSNSASPSSSTSTSSSSSSSSFSSCLSSPSFAWSIALFFALTTVILTAIVILPSSSTASTSFSALNVDSLLTLTSSFQSQVLLLDDKHSPPEREQSATDVDSISLSTSSSSSSPPPSSSFSSTPSDDLDDSSYGTHLDVPIHLQRACDTKTAFIQTWTSGLGSTMHIFLLVSGYLWSLGFRVEMFPASSSAGSGHYLAHPHCHSPVSHAHWLSCYFTPPASFAHCDAARMLSRFERAVEVDRALGGNASAFIPVHSRGGDEDNKAQPGVPQKLVPVAKPKPRQASEENDADIVMYVDDIQAVNGPIVYTGIMRAYMATIINGYSNLRSKNTSTGTTGADTYSDTFINDAHTYWSSVKQYLLRLQPWAAQRIEELIANEYGKEKKYEACVHMRGTDKGADAPLREGREYADKLLDIKVETGSNIWLIYDDNSQLSSFQSRLSSLSSSSNVTYFVSSDPHLSSRFDTVTSGGEHVIRMFANVAFCARIPEAVVTLSSNVGRWIQMERAIKKNKPAHSLDKQSDLPYFYPT